MKFLVIIFGLFLANQVNASDVFRPTSVRAFVGYMDTTSSQMRDGVNTGGQLVPVQIQNVPGFAGIASMEIKHKYNYIPEYKLDFIMNMFEYKKSVINEGLPVVVTNTDGTVATYPGAGEVVFDQETEATYMEFSHKLYYDLGYWYNTSVYVGMVYKNIILEMDSKNYLSAQNVNQKSIDDFLGGYLSILHNFDYGIQARAEIEYIHNPSLIDMTFGLSYHMNANALIGVGYKYKNYQMNNEREGLNLAVDGVFITLGYHFGSL